MSRMTDHTSTEKIGGDSIVCFVVFQVVAENCYDSLATPLGTLRVKPILCHMLSSTVIRMFNLSIVSFGVDIMHKFCDSCMFLLHSIMCCHFCFEL